jgi:hypothetical protein
MDYRDVDNLFRTCAKKTGIRVTPHIPHTSLSLLYSAGWEPEMLKQRQATKTFIRRWIPMFIHRKRKWAEAFRKASESLKMPSGKGGWPVVGTVVRAHTGI